MKQKTLRRATITRPLQFEEHAIENTLQNKHSHISQCEKYIT